LFLTDCSFFFNSLNSLKHILNIYYSWTTFCIFYTKRGDSLSWSYGSWIYNYICSQCLSPLTLRVQIPLRRGVLDTTLCDKVCQWLVTGLWFSPGTPVSSTNKTDHHIAEILLKVALNTITINLNHMWSWRFQLKIYRGKEIINDRIYM
jgi:hypothetical protein